MLPRHNRLTSARRAAGFLLLISVFGVGYFIGQLAPASGQTESGRQTLTGQQAGQPAEVDFSRFWTAWSVANGGYYGRNDQNDRVDGAISGLLGSLGDPYTMYLPKEENELFQTDLQGSFSGIGAEISQINGWPTIVSPLPGSPAERAGLRAKDIILKVDDFDTENQNFAAVINRIRGTAGSTVTLSIAREGEADPLSIAIVREKVETTNVSGQVINDGGLSYCKVTIKQFLEETDQEVKTALDDCRAQGARGAVLDVRNNPGGLLDVVVSMAGRFIDPVAKPDLKRIIVWQQDRDGRLTEYAADTQSGYDDPLVILVNEGSASAAEILAGALQDYGRAKVVGTQTFGKGSVQELRDLSDGSSIKLTVAKWLTPAKKEIDHVGVTPDIVAEDDSDSNDSVDTQLQAAVSALRSLVD